MYDLATAKGTEALHAILIRCRDNVMTIRFPFVIRPCRTLGRGLRVFQEFEVKPSQLSKYDLSQRETLIRAEELSNLWAPSFRDIKYSEHNLYEDFPAQRNSMKSTNQ